MSCSFTTGFPGDCPSGQRERAVNPSASPSVVRIHHPPPFTPSSEGAASSGNSSVGRASAFQAEGREFEPRLPLFAHVAQMVEHTLGKGEVTGSSPVMGSTQKIYEKANYFTLVFMLEVL